MSMLLSEAGLNHTQLAAHNEGDNLDIVQSPSTGSDDNISNSAILSTSEPEPQNQKPPPRPTDLATAIANFRPTPKEIINGIAPHVFDERRTRSRRRRSLSRRGSIGRGRPSSVSYDFYHPGLAGIHGSAGYSAHTGPTRRSSGSSLRPATAPYYTAAGSMKYGTSPLRISAVITVEDIDALLGGFLAPFVSVFRYRFFPKKTPLSSWSLPNFDHTGAECESAQIDDEAKVKDSGLPQGSYTLPTLGSHAKRKDGMARPNSTSGKRKATSDESASSSSSEEDGSKSVPARKSRWPSIRIDIQLFRSIGFRKHEETEAMKKLLSPDRLSTAFLPLIDPFPLSPSSWPFLVT
ncbi:hypothetical protein F5880DRAFT_1617180 [Lentinula raphanica]|nr:hypothetical protein F5880DRAFT_1617180 [Lentinula raphanica]